MTTQFWLWGGFTLFILAMLALDLGVFQRRPHVISTREAMRWFGFWTGLALLFNLGILLFHERGGQAGLEFFTGFLVEKSLSIDNVFVFILIFGYFNVPRTYQHKVLFWGIVGAIVLRAGFILGGLALMERFHWTLYVFGTFLLVTGVMMMRRKEVVYDPGKNWVIRVFRRFFPVTDRYEGNRFFTRKDGRLWATPLFIVLLAVESSTSSSRSIPSPQSSPSPPIRLSSTPRTSSRCSDCERCISRWRGSCRCFISCTTASPRSSSSSAPRCCSATFTNCRWGFRSP